jgi:predicted RNA-binding Zn-ribbon protein involved in translation (DUF1610 family)
MTIKKVTKDIKNNTFCQNPEHNPPMHICLRPGEYEHTCPECGNVQIFIVPDVTY